MRKLNKAIKRKDAKRQGLTRYFTGKACKYGHVDERMVASGRCCQCDRELQKTPEYRAKRRAFEAKEEQRRKRSIYNKTPERKKRLAEMQKESYEKNKPAYLMRFMVSRLPRVIKGKLKDYSTAEKLGYTVDEFKADIESKFKKGMNWSNHGEWHIDHIIPVSKFPKDKIKEVNNLSNLQPLWAHENLSKGDRL